MIAIIDYGVGNLFSLKGSLAALGLDAAVTSDPEALVRADRIILPGVGAFGDARKKLEESGMEEALLAQVSAGKPLLGICLGMQLLFSESEEYGVHPGLGLIPGRVVPIARDLPCPRKVPHMGWNALEFVKESPIFRDTEPGAYVYYVHSFYARDCAPSVTAISRYGIEITGAVQKDNIFGTQFHPEKSGKTGLKILKAFSEV